MLLILLRTHSPLTRMARVVSHGALHGEAAEGTQREANFNCSARPPRLTSAIAAAPRRTLRTKTSSAPARRPANSVRRGVNLPRGGILYKARAGLLYRHAPSAPRLKGLGRPRVCIAQHDQSRPDDHMHVSHPLRTKQQSLCQKDPPHQESQVREL
jgi:hypothetical protein